MVVDRHTCITCLVKRSRRVSASCLASVCIVLLVLVYLLSPDTQGKASRDVSRYLNKLKNTSNDDSSMDTTMADALRSKVRVLCLILTVERDFDTKARAAKYTWARRCHKYFFVLSTWRRAPNIINTNITETRNNIVHKVRQALTFVFDHYIDDFDWLLKADDDTYVIMENLRYLLSHYDPHTPGHLGYHYKEFMSQGFMSGGAGYVISNAAMRMLIESGINTRLCDVTNLKLNAEFGEDLHVGYCLQKLGVQVLSSLDSQNRETFHPNDIETHLLGELPVYVTDMAWNTPQIGPECCSRFTISYHYVTPEVMVVIEHLLYRTSVFGRNTKPDKDQSLPAFKIKHITP